MRVVLVVLGGCTYIATYLFNEVQAEGVIGEVDVVISDPFILVLEGEGRGGEKRGRR